MFVLDELSHLATKLKHTKLTDVATMHLSLMLRTAAFGLVGVFIPIYLYNLGFAVATILFFYVLLFIARPFTDYWAGSLLKKIGPKHMIVAAYVLMWLQLGLLLLLEYLPLAVPLVFIVGALALAFFWVPLQLEIIVNTSSHHEGRESGTLYAIQKLASAITPLIGGLVAAFFGIQYTFLLAIILIIVATVPLLATKEMPRRKRFALPGISDYRKQARIFGLNAGSNALYITSIITWPLFVGLFVFGEDVYSPLGFITTMSLLVTAMTAYYWGKLSDDRQAALRILKTNAVLSYVANSLRPLVSNFTAAMGLNMMAEPVQAGVNVPIDEMKFRESANAGSGALARLLVWMAYMHAARLVFALLAWLLVVIFGSKFGLQASFLLAALAPLSYLFIKRLRS